MTQDSWGLSVPPDAARFVACRMTCRDLVGSPAAGYPRSGVACSLRASWTADQYL